MSEDGPDTGYQSHHEPVESEDDPLFEDFDTLYRCCQLLQESLHDAIGDVGNLYKHHNRQSVREALDDLDMVDRFLETFKAEMDPREEPI